MPSVNEAAFSIFQSEFHLTFSQPFSSHRADVFVVDLQTLFLLLKFLIISA